MSEAATTPDPLTGGSGRRFGPLGREMRPLPDIALSEPSDDYARLIAWGFDTIQEAHPYAPDGALIAKLKKAKEAAQDARQNGLGVSLFELGGYRFLCHATGASGGVAYRLEDDVLIFLIRSENCDWGVSVRYKAAGLWEHGWDNLRERVREILTGSFVRAENEDAERLSRADYAFDFYSPQFSADFNLAKLRELLVCHSSTKGRWLAEVIGTSWRDQTVTVGKSNSLQVTVYDKAAEINEASGKTWMEEVWAQTTAGEVLYDTPKPSDIWRLEIRMGKAFLKNRNAQSVSAFLKYRDKLIMEALNRIRLSAPDGEECVRNRPMHPLWSLAFEHIDDGKGEMLPFGRRVTGRRQALVAQAEAQIAGAVRSATILAGWKLDDDGLEIILARAKEIALTDPEADRKEKAARDRYEFVDEAR